MSVAGGVDRAVDRAAAVQCRTLQIFTKNASQWTGPPIAPETVSRFRDRLADTGIAPVVSHDSYLINLASADGALRDKSMAAFRDELERAELLRLMGVVTHPGAHVGAGEAPGLARVAEALRRILDETAGQNVQILIENTAGQGSSLGWHFDHLATLLHGVERHPRVGFCLDTCHLHAAGYDLTSDASYARVMGEFDAAVGLDRLRCLHLNDALKPLGSRVDRHTHIGDGTLGLEPFRRIMNDTRLVAVPKILETPKNGEGFAEDTRNLTTLRRLGGEPGPLPIPPVAGADLPTAPAAPKPARPRRPPRPAAAPGGAAASAPNPPPVRARRSTTSPRAETRPATRSRRGTGG